MRSKRHRTAVFHRPFLNYTMPPREIKCETGFFSEIMPMRTAFGYAAMHPVCQGQHSGKAGKSLFPRFMGIRNARLMDLFWGISINCRTFPESSLKEALARDMGTSIYCVRRLFVSEQRPTGKIFSGYVFR